MLEEIGYLYIGIAILLAIISFVMTTEWSHAGTFWVIVIAAVAIGYFFKLPHWEFTAFTRYCVCIGGSVIGWFLGGLANAGERLEKAQRKFDRWLDEK